MSRRCLENLDPKREDVATSPRRRRHRAKPESSPDLAAQKPKALSRARIRPMSPGIMYEPDWESYRATSPHSDAGLWELQLADAFGTRSASVMRQFIEDLRRLCSQAWDEPNGAWKPSEYELNAVLAMVADLQPRNTAEAGMAAQMVAVHLLTMRLPAQALNSGGMMMEKDVALTGKLARTYAMQMEAYQGLRGKRRTSRQTITVRKELHQTVHYHDHRGQGRMSSNLKEPTNLANAPRCQARTKSGKSCGCPAVAGKRVCRVHGGKSPGAPKGSANGAWRHGQRTNEAIALRRAARNLLEAIDG